MNNWKTDELSQPFNPNLMSNTSAQPPINPNQDYRPKPDLEVKDPITARKVQKADREKLRRDRLNEHFLELGKAIDPEKPKNDKGTILGDTILVLKDLTAEVGKLKAEYTALSEEARELTQEKNELREEKASLKSQVENLNLHYQQRINVMYPWAQTYAYQVPYTVPAGPIPMQPFTIFGNQNIGSVPNPCSTFIQYPSQANHHIDPASTQCASTSRVSNKHDCKIKGPDRCKVVNSDKSDECNDVVTELELKAPGSTIHKDKSPGERKSRHTHNKENNSVVTSSSSKNSSSQRCQDSSSKSTENSQR